MQKLFQILTVLGLLAAPAAAQDEVKLQDGQTLTGRVTAIGDDGTVVLKSGFSPVPLQIRGESATRISFESGPEGSGHSEILHLANGDTLPGVFVGLNDEEIEFSTPYAGALRIPRSLTSSIDFGVAPQRLVFEGPGNLQDWENNDDWKLSGATLTSSTNSTIARPGVLPNQFILRFRIEWVGTPSLRFYFCDDVLKASGADANRYYFEFNSAGIQLKRETNEDGRRWHPLVSLPLKPRSFPRAKLDVELRVDRFQRIIHVYVNNESQGSYRDPIGEFPDGTGIFLESLAGGGSKNIVSRIEIYEWDAVSQLRRAEGHENVTLDALISTGGERFSGEARAVVMRDGVASVRFASPHSDDDLLVPRDRISTLYFRTVEESIPARATHVLDLRDTGRLSISNPTLSDRELACDHPLLGEITIDRNALLMLDRIGAKSD